ncbi:hypothetical protein NL676_024236 [Syzygium grande]|nr:hypothetical protein NL676_024236 [Syzygium grande]
MAKTTNTANGKLPPIPPRQVPKSHPFAPPELHSHEPHSSPWLETLRRVDEEQIRLFPNLSSKTADIIKAGIQPPLEEQIKVKVGLNVIRIFIHFLIECENDSTEEVFLVGFGDSWHKLHGLVNFLPDKIPPWGLSDEREDPRKEEHGGNGGSNVESPPEGKHNSDAGKD